MYIIWSLSKKTTEKTRPQSEKVLLCSGDVFLFTNPSCLSKLEIQ